MENMDTKWYQHQTLHVFSSFWKTSGFIISKGALDRPVQHQQQGIPAGDDLWHCAYRGWSPSWRISIESYVYIYVCVLYMGISIYWSSLSLDILWSNIDQYIDQIWIKYWWKSGPEFNWGDDNPWWENQTWYVWDFTSTHYSVFQATWKHRSWPIVKGSQAF